MFLCIGNTIAGQGTLAKEILNQSKEDNVKFDYLFAAIGGGGLISGVGTYFKEHSPNTSIVGVEPAGAIIKSITCKNDFYICTTEKFNLVNFL